MICLKYLKASPKPSKIKSDIKILTSQMLGFFMAI